MTLHTLTITLAILLLSLTSCNTSTKAVKSAVQEERKLQASQEAAKQEKADPANTLRKPGTVSKKGTHIRVLVNNTPITNYDIARRSAFLKLRRVRGNRTKLAEEEMIEQALKLEEARKRRSVATKKQVNDAFNKFAKRNRVPSSRMARELERMGVGAKHFKRFISTQISWQRTVGGKFRSDTQKKTQQNAIFELKQAGSDKPETTEYVIKQIVFVVPADKRKAILSARRKEANGLRQRFTSCDGAIALAKELRDVTVVDRGRVLEPELPPEWREAILATEPGKTTRPIDTAKGIELIAICSKKTVSDDRAAQIVNQSKEFDSFNKKSSKVADEYLQELRKKAVIIYR